MPAIIVLLLLALLLFGAVLAFFRGHAADRAFRENILREKARLSDAEYREKLPFLHTEEDIRLALLVRGALAGIAGLPRECISPEMPLEDVVRAQESYFSEFDAAEILMALEDELGTEIPEGSSGIVLSPLETAASCTVKVIGFAHGSWWSSGKGEG